MQNEEMKTRSSGAKVFSGPLVRVSWGAVLAGTVTTLGIAVLLHSLGMALGLSWIEPDDLSSLRTSSIFTGVWGAVTLIVALFVGGHVASRGVAAVTRTSGAVHGLVTWALTTVIGTMLVVSVIGRAVSGAVGIGTSVVQVGAGAVAGASDDVESLALSLGITGDDLLGPINERLRAQGKPEVTADQLSAATRDAVQTALRQGRLDRELIVTSIAEHAALTRADARELAADLERNLSAAGTRAGAAVRSIQQDALAVAEDAGMAFWGAFVGLFLGMLAAVFGATIGIRKRQKIWIEKHPGFEGALEVNPFAPPAETWGRPVSM